MSWEQITVILAVIGSLITTIGTVTVSIFSLWFQGQQELKRNAQAQSWQEIQIDKQRVWSVEDRNIAHTWHLTDRQIEERKRLLLEHKQVVDAFITHLLIDVHRVRTGGPRRNDESSELAFANEVADRSSQVRYHINVFGNSELTHEFHLLEHIVEEFFSYMDVVTEAGEGDKEKAFDLHTQIEATAAKMTRIIETIIVNEMQPKM